MLLLNNMTIIVTAREWVDTYPPTPEALNRSILCSGNVKWISRNVSIIKISREASPRPSLYVLRRLAARRTLGETHTSKNCRRRDDTVTT